ncbi:MAG: DUF1318 domain-containing protein [candidate division KSB1 bacterium]|jgi:uncharacterized protein YdbL (DUF1318 family)|nr:DUF1318 domain-containing protein [candidate division KSB1 bacterium]
MKNAFIILSILLVNCSVKAPEVKITGEKTALENQVIGTYREIEQDSWTIASVRSSSEGKAQQISEEKKKVLTAVQSRKFNQDDINEFKRDGSVGENNMGYLEIRETEKLRGDPEYRTRVTTIVQEENMDRETIMLRSMQINENIEDAGQDAVKRVFAKIYQDESAVNSWIQLDDGIWVQKQ